MSDSSLIRLVHDRGDYLRYLQDEPATKRDVVDDLDVSRATVHRVMDTLLDADLVRKTNDGLATTTAGTLLLETVADATATSETVHSARELLEHLPADAPLDPVFLRDATAFPVEPPGPEPNIERGIDRLERATHLYGLGVGDNNTRWVETIHEESVIGERTHVDLVMTEALTGRSIERYDDWVADSIRSDYADLRYAPDLPYALFITEAPETSTAHLLVHGDRSEYLGHFEADSQVAVDWARSVFQRYFANANPVSELVE